MKLNYRNRRSIMEVLQVPHTKWCGRGYTAGSFQDMGGLHEVDKCCRLHDMECPFYITSFDMKYGLRNWGITTWSHCSCDIR